MHYFDLSFTPLTSSILQYNDGHSLFLLLTMTEIQFPVTIMFADMLFAASPSVETLAILMKWVGAIQHGDCILNLTSTRVYSLDIDGAESISIYNGMYICRKFRADD